MSLNKYVLALQQCRVTAALWTEKDAKKELAESEVKQPAAIMVWRHRQLEFQTNFTRQVTWPKIGQFSNKHVKYIWQPAKVEVKLVIIKLHFYYE